MTILLAAALGVMLALGLPAGAATFYTSPTGSGTACSEASPCSVSQLLSTLNAGDTGIFKAGTYSNAAHRITISGKSGTPGNPITLRAENYAVSCADPTNDPDGCAISTSNRSVLSSGGTQVLLSGADADYWNIEGFEVDDTGVSIACLGSAIGSGPDHINIRYMHVHYEQDVGGGGASMQFEYCQDFVVEHSYFHDNNLGAPGPDYAVQLIRGSRNATIRNVHFSGHFNHGISVKRDADDVLIERIVCKGANSECIFVGQNFDDSLSISGGTSCPSVQLGNGTTDTIFDHTSENITIRRVYAVPATGFTLRLGLRISNARNADIQDYFVANTNETSYSVAHVADGDINAQAVGRCGVEPGNNSIRGLIVVNPNRECFRIESVGHDPDALTIDNYICHNPNGQQAFSWAGITDPNGAWETTQHPVSTIRNGVNNDCLAQFDGGVNNARVTDNHNDVFNCGSSRGGTGDLTVDPQFVGPETVTTPTLSFTNGTQLWDWANTYQPIIDRFRTQNAALEDAGTGTDGPCTAAACDVGANESFFELPPDVWESCAVYDNGDDVFGSFTNPWIDGRTGLVIDIDCAQKRIVIGRCNNPEDESTCDTDIYIHKAAQLRKQRVNEPITLNPGTTGSDADTSGTCWRTRATYDFTESLEHLTGIWVRYEIDPDGGTHTCSAVSAPQWAWQGAE